MSSKAKADILIVDDIPANRDLLTVLLTKSGYGVRAAENGRQALQRAHESPPDMILLDINMPDISGYEVAAQVKQDPALNEVPIIFLSSLNEAEDKVRAFAAGGVDYVTKPFQFEEISARITTHLKIRHLQQDLQARNQAYERANEELLRLDGLRDRLTAASKFGMWWTYYQQFDGQSVGPECRRSALDFLHAYDESVRSDESIAAVFANGTLQKTAALLRAWANDAETNLPEDGSLNLTNVLLFLTVYRGRVESQISARSANTDQIVHPDVARRLEGYLKWRGHFPRIRIRADLQATMEKACLSNSIVVVGDIRRSQDLMTYALDDQDFSRRMVEFIAQTRCLLDKYGGFFDKFTGDGFLGYFNESIGELHGSHYIDSFIGFIREFTTFCNGHFREWVRFVRKVPDQPVGLAIGADLGHVSFQSLDYHVVAVGESIVWASRMASAAGAEEVVVNNLLYQALRNQNGLAFTAQSAATKSGESFQAWKMETQNLAR